MRKITALILSFSLFSQSALAGVSSSSPDKAMNMYEEFLKMSPQKGLWKGIAGAEYISQGITVQVLGLQPEDFNLFMLYLMQRYIHKPEERDKIVDFIQIFRPGMADDLEFSRRLRQGDTGHVYDRSFIYMFGVLLAGLTFRKIFAAPLRNSELLRQVRVKATRNTTLRYSGRVLGNAWVYSSLGGIGLSHLQYIMFEKSRNRRLDPNPILRVVQAQIACQLSFETLELYEKVENLVVDEEKLQAEKIPLRSALKRISDETAHLLKDYEELENLDVADRKFQENLDFLPNVKDFQDLRSQLTSSEDPANGQCRQVPIVILLKKLSELDTVIPQLDPPANPQPSQPTAPDQEMKKP